MDGLSVPWPAQPVLGIDRDWVVRIDAIMRGLVGMSSLMESARRFQSYFLARRVGEKFFPNLCTVMWPSPLIYKALRRFDMVDLDPHMRNGNYGEVCDGLPNLMLSAPTQRRAL